MVTKRKRVPNRAKRASLVRESATVFEPGGGTFSRRISAGEFKARCLALMDEVRDTSGEYVITKRGEPVAKLVPARTKRRPLLGSMKGTVRVIGEIVSPLDEPWDALVDDDES
jgi:prevent-host-death family protein